LFNCPQKETGGDCIFRKKSFLEKFIFKQIEVTIPLGGRGQSFFKQDCQKDRYLLLSAFSEFFDFFLKNKKSFSVRRKVKSWLC
jgi:hypothetical protein